ncbi:patched domain-containing protein 3-like [Culicoides brevitarsis]|uniref:patched domain-containing protein 3-like n=1 Tax=Culicoides brevitarsis TaxID=469753 RepID=UPI00307B28DA
MSEDVKTKNNLSDRLPGQNLSYYVSRGIGKQFYRIGKCVSSHPWQTIIGAWTVVALCSLGFLRFYNERDPLKLWVPKESQFLKDTEWIMNRFEEGTRVQAVLITADDVLKPEVLQRALKVHRQITSFSITESNGTRFRFSDLCFKIPIIAEYTTSERKPKKPRNVKNDSAENFFSSKEEITTENPKPKKKKPSKPFEASVDLPSDFYCSLVESLPSGCLLENLLELWNFEDERLPQSKNEILGALNETVISPYSGHQMDYEHLLGGVTRDESGKIVAAKALLARYNLYVNFSQADSSKVGNMAGTEDWASESTMAWEKKFLNLISKMKKTLENNSTDNFKLYYAAGRSYGDISNETMFEDIDKLVFGIILMFIYMQLVLSRFSWTEIRIQLSSFGLMAVGMGFIAGCGICSLLGVSYGPVHTSLPFLLMGLGVDDIFVMMACWRKIQVTNADKSKEERFGLMLQHAGASITVTSITDIVAFLVGGLTILPSLQSFCIYAAVCILMTYCFVVTFFVAIFALDERRIEQRRNAFVPCVIHTEEQSKIWYQKNLMHTFLEYVYSNFILTKVGKILIIMSVICTTGLNIESLLHLRQKFDPSWFIPPNTYLGQYTNETRVYYPEMGSEVSILVGKINYTEDMSKLLELSRNVANQTDILHHIRAWPNDFQDFVMIHHQKNINNLTDVELRTYLSQFLYSQSGGRYQPNFRFEHPLKCGEPTPNVTVSQITFKFKKFYEREDYLPAQHKMEDLVKEANLSSGEGFSTVWGKVFGNWITDEIIDQEIYRNIGLALLGVMGCTMIVIVNVQVCFWIFVTVLLTLINVGGCMQRVGQTLDIVSCIALQLSVGLCVDYAAHIGHTFLTINEGNRTERALKTTLHIGAAVFYGGGSTILALSVLANSQAYTYRSFFRIFFLVIAFGLFHGVVLLPVILSVVGPRPYKKCEKPALKETEMEAISFIDRPEDMKDKVTNGYIPVNKISLGET